MRENNAMRKVFAREGLLYDREELLEALGYCADSERDRMAFQRFLGMLKRKRLLKTRRKKGSREASEDDASLIAEDGIDYEDYVGVEKQGTQYLFRFVGMVFHDDRVVNVYPKYIEDTGELDSKMKQVMHVIRKHQGKMYQLDVPKLLEAAERGEEINMLSVILFLVDDYSQNRLYYEDERITECNGENEIAWGKTVEMLDPIFVQGRPVYVDTFTTRRKDNQGNYFVRLHRLILTLAFRELEEIGLSELFSLPVIALSDEEIDDFGSSDYIREMIDREIRVQFDDRKLSVLRGMDLYIAKKAGRCRKHMQAGEEGVSFFGTRAFHNVWEDVINEVYGSQRDKTFADIQANYFGRLDYAISLPNGSCANIEGAHILSKAIEKPEWHLSNPSGSSEEGIYLPDKTFLPDYLKFSERDGTFYIMDAKYYVPRWHITEGGEKRIERQPGVEDVVKQYMYYLAYRPLLEHNSIDVSHVKNFYIMPTEGEDKDVGYARLGFFAELLPDVFDIRVKMINAEKVFSHYLQGDKLDVASMPSGSKSV